MLSDQEKDLVVVVAEYKDRTVTELGGTESDKPVERAIAQELLGHCTKISPIHGNAHVTIVVSQKSQTPMSGNLGVLFIALDDSADSIVAIPGDNNNKVPKMCFGSV